MNIRRRIPGAAHPMVTKPTRRLRPALTGLVLAALVLPARGMAADMSQLLRLLEQRSCPGCRLQDADLVHADLRDADLSGASLQRANLGRARLDGARLGGADLSFTSLQGASLRGADLRGARLEGTDLRHSDLSGALLDAGALSRSHWRDATGLSADQLSYPQWHNAGVEAAMAGRHPEAERMFGEAIRQQPEAAVSWVARGLSRAEQGNKELAASDLTYAATLYEQGGDVQSAEELRQAAERLVEPGKKPPGGNGIGSQLIGGAAGLVQGLAPLAIKYFAPLAF